MKCDKIQKMLSDYVTGNLEENIIDEINKHLQQCQKCHHEYTMLDEMWSKMALIPAERPADRLSTNFYSMLKAYKNGMQQAGTAGHAMNRLVEWIERWWPRKVAVQFGIALACLMIGITFGHWSGSLRSQNGEIVKLKTEVRNMSNLVTISLLNQQSPMERLKGISWSSQLDQPDKEVISALLSTLNHDPNVNVRLAAANALALYGNDQMIKQGLIRSLQQQKSPLLQVELIGILVNIKDKTSITAFKELIQDRNINQIVRERAQWGIAQLS